MSEKREVDIRYHDNGNWRCEIPKLNGNIHGLARWWWHDNGQLFEEANWRNGKRHGLYRWWWSNSYFGFLQLWHKDILVFELKFEKNEKISAPKPSQPIFSANQFLELCQMQ